MCYLHPVVVTEWCLSLVQSSAVGSLPVWAGFHPYEVTGPIRGHVGLELNQTWFLTELW